MGTAVGSAGAVLAWRVRQRCLLRSLHVRVWGPTERGGLVYPCLIPLLTQSLTTGGVLVAHSRSGLHLLLDLFPVASCVTVSSPQSTEGTGTAHGLELNSNPSDVSLANSVIFREEGEGVERK